MCSLMEQRARQIENAAVRAFVEAVRHHAVAFALAPRLQRHSQPLCHPLRRGRIAVSLTELGCIACCHDDERHMKTPLGLFRDVTEAGLKRAALG